MQMGGVTEERLADYNDAHGIHIAKELMQAMRGGSRIALLSLVL